MDPTSFFVHFFLKRSVLAMFGFNLDSPPKDKVYNTPDDRIMLSMGSTISPTKFVTLPTFFINNGHFHRIKSQPAFMKRNVRFLKVSRPIKILSFMCDRLLVDTNGAISGIMVVGGGGTFYSVFPIPKIHCNRIQ